VEFKTIEVQAISPCPVSPATNVTPYLENECVEVISCNITRMSWDGQLAHEH